MRSYTLSWIIILFSALFVTGSVLFTHNLTRQFAEVEQQRMEIWAEATRQLVMADENTDISLYSSIIEANTTIPVYMTDADYRVILTRNVREPKQNIDAFYEKKIAKLRETQTPIEVHVAPGVTQYIFYEQSHILRRLQLFPWIQMLVVLSFMALLITYILTSYRNEQNRVWVGLTKETAHQLGTPISSLNGWLELLQSRYPDDDLLPEMNTDISRLQLIAERFSRIGSIPKLQPTDISQVLGDSYTYMRARVSNKVDMTLSIDPFDAGSMPASNGKQAYVTLGDAPLLKWVIENLIKNAVDAMDGQGTLTLHLQRDGKDIILDVTDTGRGIEHRRLRQIFRPGYTTKTRGWGLGLSLCKRIIEQYHRGKIFVLRSAVGVGSTFRVILHATE